MADIAFIDVDTQYDFMDPNGNLYVEGSEEIVPNIARMLDHARENRIPVVGSVDAHVEKDPEFQDFPPHCVKGTPGQKKLPETSLPLQKIIPQDVKVDDALLAPPGPVILEKSAIDGMLKNPNIDVALKSTGAKKFIVFGVALDYCVKTAIEGLLDRGYEVDLVTDATRSVDPEKGRKVLEQLKKRGVGTITTEEVLRVTA